MKRCAKLASCSRVVFRMGKRIYLRPITKEDLPLITVWINDQEVTRFLKISFPMSQADEERWLERRHENKEKEVAFAIVLLATDEIIGVMGLNGISYRDGTAKTGSFIGRKDLWGKGFGTEAKMLVLEYAFNTLNLRKICSSVYDFNGRSRRCLEKCGYKLEGILKEQNHRNGKYVDQLLLAVFKDDFLKIWEVYRKKNGM